MQIQSCTQLENVHQRKQRLQILRILTHVLQQYFGQYHNFVLLVQLKFLPLLRFGDVPALHCFVEFLSDAFRKNCEVFQPTIVAFRQNQYDLQKEDIVLLLVFSHFC